jgi:hypothetical protein
MNSGGPMYSLSECLDKSRLWRDKEAQNIMHRQSDYSIVSGKSMKVDGEKGVAGTREEGRDTPAGHRAADRMRIPLLAGPS